MSVPHLSRLLRTTRSPIDAAVDELMSRLSGVSGPASEAALVAAAVKVCGAPITVEEVAQPQGRYGLVARTAQGHVISLDPHLPGDLRLHTLLHEIGHVLLGHNAEPDVGAPDRLTALVTGQPVTNAVNCAVPEFRQWAQRENDAEQFASTVARRLRRGLTGRRLSRLDEAFG